MSNSSKTQNYSAEPFGFVSRINDVPTLQVSGDPHIIDGMRVYSEDDYFTLEEKIETLQNELKRMIEARDGLRSALNEANKCIAYQRDNKPDFARIAALEASLSAFVNWKTDDHGTRSLLDDDELWANAEAALLQK